MGTRAWFVGIVAAAVAAASSGSARGADAPRPGSEPVDLTVGDGTEVREILKAVSTHTGIAIVWDEGDKALQRRVTGPSKLKVQGGTALFDYVRDLLAAREIVLVPFGDPVTYVAMDVRMLMNQFILRNTPTIVDVNDQNADQLARRNGLFVMAVFDVPPGVEPSAARSVLARLVTQNNVGSIFEFGRRLVVVDFAPNVVAIHRLLQRMPRAATDAPTSPDEPRVEAFRLGDAETTQRVAAALHDLVSPRQPDGKPAGGLPRVVADTATSQVLVYGTEAQVRTATDVVEVLARRGR